MEIVFDREAFASKFSLAASIAPPRSPKEILRNVKVTASDGSVSLSATDMEVGVRTDVDGIVAIKSEGSALLPVQRMGAILRESSAETLSLKVTDKGLVVKSNRSTFRLPHANPDEFPPVAAFDGERYHRIAGRMFRSMVNQTGFASDPKSVRYMLGGVLFEMEGDSVAAVASDGKRLAYVEGSGESFGEHRSTNSMVPIKAAQFMSRAITDSDETVDVAISDSDARLLTSDATIYARLLSGRFIPWRKLIPSPDKSVEMIAGTFHSALREAAIVSSQESNSLRLLFEAGELRIDASTADVGQSSVVIPVPYDDEPTEIVVDGRFLMDFCKVLDREENFSFAFSDPNKPLFLTADSGCSYIVQPMGTK